MTPTRFHNFIRLVKFRFFSLFVFSGLALMLPVQAETLKPSPGIVGIAHVAFQVSNIEKSVQQYTDYYGFVSAFSTQADGSDHYLKINDDQFIKLVEVDGKTADNRLIEIAFEVTDLSSFVSFLKQKGYAPSNPSIAADGTLSSSLIGPSQHKLRFIEYLPNSMQAKTKGRFLGEDRVANRLLHVGFTVTNEAEANAFYQQTLAFSEIWRAARTDDGPDAWVNMQIPDSRGDYVEYVLIEGMQPSRNQLGSMNHICFLSDDIEKTRQHLAKNGLDDLSKHQPMVGRSNRWIVNVHDLDGTRAEFMETKPAF